jgi:DNA-binding IclR family transcriptional regulator
VGNPPLERGILILDFLTTHPRQGFTLSELSRRLRISKSTCYGLLTTLTNRGLVVRDPRSNEYRLGPGLIPMGAVAEREFPALTLAKREADSLASDYDGECVITMVTGDEVLIVGRAGLRAPLGFNNFEGQRHPMAAPLGVILMSWQNDDTVEEWLDRLGPELSESERERHRAAVADARRRGYAVALRASSVDDLVETQRRADLYTPQGRAALAKALGALAHDEYLVVGDGVPPDARISSIGAPVFGPNGTILFAISLQPGEQHHGDELASLVRAVVGACARVTAAIDGRPPSFEPQTARKP